MIARLRTGLVLATTVLMVSAALGQSQDRQKDKDQGKHQGKDPSTMRDMHSGVDWDQAIAQMKANGVTLQDAISKAVSNCGGDAIAVSARIRHSSMRPHGTQPGQTDTTKVAQYQIEVQCRTDDGMFKRVLVDGQTGDVIETSGASASILMDERYEDERIVTRDQPQTTVNFKIIKFTTLDDAQVRNNSDEDLGKITDLAIDPQSGRVSYAAVSFGGLLGMGDKLFAVPLNAMDVVSEDRVLMDVTKEELKNAEGFNQDKWPVHASRQWGGELRTTRSDSGETVGRENALTGQRTYDDDSPITSIKKGTKLVGMKVENRQDEDLGKIIDLYVDMRGERICYALLSHGGVLGVGDKLYAIPWSSFQTQGGDENELVLDISKSRLEQAPGAREGDHGTWDNPEWIVTVYEFHQVEPYWKNQDSDRSMRDGQDRDRDNRERTRDNPRNP